jgi:hypothetical protein
MAHHESLTELLRVPSLRSVCFKVLSAVRSDINCVFLHLLENPTGAQWTWPVIVPRKEGDRRIRQIIRTQSESTIRHSKRANNYLADDRHDGKTQ